MAEMVDLYSICDLCGEDHPTEQCPELLCVPVEQQLGDYMTKARLTLPSCLEVMDQRIGYNGVYAKAHIPAKTTLGPYEAKRTTHVFDDTGFFTLKVVSKSGNVVCLDTTDENECNWLCLVRPAESLESQNCRAYQIGSNIYFSTMHDIKPGVELQVWYTPTYARKLGKSVTPDLSKALLGHRIEAIPADIVPEPTLEGEPDDASQQQQQQQQTTNSMVVNALQEKTGEIKKTIACPRCGDAFTSQSLMVQHLRDHVHASGTHLSVFKKRGPGRPRIHPIQDKNALSNHLKRKRGRPKKADMIKREPVADFAEYSEDDEDEVAADDDTYDRVVFGEADYDIDEDNESKRFRIDEDEIDDCTDKDYTPLYLVTGSSVRKQPARKRKGKNSLLAENYVVGNTRKKHVPQTHVKQDATGAETTEKTESNKGEVVKRKRGRPRLSDLVKNAFNMDHNKSEVVADKPNNAPHIVSGRIIDANSSGDVTDSAALHNDVQVIEQVCDTTANSDETSHIDETTNNIIEAAKVEHDNLSIVDKESIVSNSNIGSQEPVENGSVPNSDIEANESPHQMMETNIAHLNDSDNIGNSRVKALLQQDSSLEAHQEEASSSSIYLEETKVSQDYESESNAIEMIENKLEQSEGIELQVEETNEESIADEIFENDEIDNSNTDAAVLDNNNTPVSESLSIQELNMMRETNSDEGPHVCDICKQEFKTKMYLYRHMVMHTDIFRCIRCKKTFSRKDSLQKHVMKCCPDHAEGLGILHCEKCLRVFSMESGRQKHMLKCEAAVCGGCGGRFRNKEALEEHTCKGEASTGKYSCSKCDKSFQSLHYLKQHALIHQNLYTCSRCNKSLPSQEQLDSHTQTCQAIESIKLLGQSRCEQCDQTFTSAKQFREHMLSHTHPYQCGECFRRFVKVGSLSNHECTSNAEAVSCQVCSKVFKNKEGLERHINDNDCLRYQCTACQKLFHLRADARDHECNPDIPEVDRKIVYASENQMMCNVCGKSFSTKSNLLKHMQLHGEKNLLCPHCDKRFHLLTYLKQHIQGVHFKLGNCQCTACGKIFKSRSGFNQHKAVFHSGKNITSYACSDCSKVFYSKASLKAHMYTHSTVRNFKCGDCDKTYKFPDQLSRHKLEHKGTRVGCTYCDKEFSQKHLLKRHIQIYHSGYVYVCGLCSSKCLHRHTLVRHYKNKHPESSALLTQEGYVNGLLKHISKLPGYKPEESEEMPIEDAQDAQQDVYNMDATKVLPEEAVKALASLSMGTCTMEEYQILKDQGLIKSDDIVDQQSLGLTENQTLIVSEDGSLITGTTTNQLMIPQEQQIILPQTENIVNTNIQNQIGLIQNADGTININDIQGLPQTLETLESKDGQIVILQIVEASDQFTTDFNQGEIIQQFPSLVPVSSAETAEETGAIVGNMKDIVNEQDVVNGQQVVNIQDVANGHEVISDNTHLVEIVNIPEPLEATIIGQNEAQTIQVENNTDQNMIADQEINTADSALTHNYDLHILTNEEADDLVRQNEKGTPQIQILTTELPNTNTAVRQNGEGNTQIQILTTELPNTNTNTSVRQNGEANTQIQIMTTEQADTLVRQNEEGTPQIHILTTELPNTNTAVRQNGEGSTQIQILTNEIPNASVRQNGERDQQIQILTTELPDSTVMQNSEGTPQIQILTTELPNTTVRQNSEEVLQIVETVNTMEVIAEENIVSEDTENTIVEPKISAHDVLEAIPNNVTFFYANA